MYQKTAVNRSFLIAHRVNPTALAEMIDKVSLYVHCCQFILTSQMNSFIYEVSILIFDTVELNTDFANINIFL